MTSMGSNGISAPLTARVKKILNQLAVIRHRRSDTERPVENRNMLLYIFGPK